MLRSLCAVLYAIAIMRAGGPQREGGPDETYAAAIIVLAPNPARSQLLRGSVTVSDDNPYAEAVFRTLKYRPGCANLRFDSLEEAAAWADQLVRWYNHQHLHSAIGFVTPHDRHTGADIAILEARRALYKRAHRAHPERWTRHVRAWRRPVKVRLNPDRPTIVLKPRTEGCAA